MSFWNYGIVDVLVRIGKANVLKRLLLEKLSLGLFLIHSVS
jgi:hypothetical protein